MSPSDKKRKSKSRRPEQARRPAGRNAERAGKATASADRPGTGASRWREKRPVLWFVALLAILMGAFNLLFYTYLSDAAFFHQYLSFNARAAAAVLGLFGTHANVSGEALTSEGFTLGIRRGCDAVQATAFFVFLVFASPSPVSLFSRIPYVLLGTLFLLVLNLARIITLYYSGVYGSKALFDFLHVDLWQAVFIFLPLFLWVLWTRRAERIRTDKPTDKPDVSV